MDNNRVIEHAKNLEKAIHDEILAINDWEAKQTLADEGIMLNMNLKDYEKN
jgi:hypothetical protein